MLKVTLVRSLIGLKPNHVRTLTALGLRKIRASVRHDDTPAIRGMLARIPYAVRVERDGSEAPGAEGRSEAAGARSRRDHTEGAR